MSSQSQISQAEESADTGVTERIWNDLSDRFKYQMAKKYIENIENLNNNQSSESESHYLTEAEILFFAESIGYKPSENFFIVYDIISETESCRELLKTNYLRNNANSNESDAAANLNESDELPTIILLHRGEHNFERLELDLATNELYTIRTMGDDGWCAVHAILGEKMNSESSDFLYSKTASEQYLDVIKSRAIENPVYFRDEFIRRLWTLAEEQKVIKRGVKSMRKLLGLIEMDNDPNDQAVLIESFKSLGGLETSLENHNDDNINEKIQLSLLDSSESATNSEVTHNSAVSDDKPPTHDSTQDNINVNDSQSDRQVPVNNRTVVFTSNLGNVVTNLENFTTVTPNTPENVNNDDTLLFSSGPQSSDLGNLRSLVSTSPNNNNIPYNGTKLLVTNSEGPVTPTAISNVLNTVVSETIDSSIELNINSLNISSNLSSIIPAESGAAEGGLDLDESQSFSNEIPASDLNFNQIQTQSLTLESQNLSGNSVSMTQTPRLPLPALPLDLSLNPALASRRRALQGSAGPIIHSEFNVTNTTTNESVDDDHVGDVNIDENTQVYEYPARIQNHQTGTHSAPVSGNYGNNYSTIAPTSINPKKILFKVRGDLKLRSSNFNDQVHDFNLDDVNHDNVNGQPTVSGPGRGSSDIVVNDTIPSRLSSTKLDNDQLQYTTNSNSTTLQAQNQLDLSIVLDDIQRAIEKVEPVTEDDEHETTTTSDRPKKFNIWTPESDSKKTITSSLKLTNFQLNANPNESEAEPAAAGSSNSDLMSSNLTSTSLAPRPESDREVLYSGTTPNFGSPSMKKSIDEDPELKKARQLMSETQSLLMSSSLSPTCVMNNSISVSNINVVQSDNGNKADSLNSDSKSKSTESESHDSTVLDETVSSDQFDFDKTPLAINRSKYNKFNLNLNQLKMSSMPNMSSETPKTVATTDSISTNADLTNLTLSRNTVSTPRELGIASGYHGPDSPITLADILDASNSDTESDSDKIKLVSDKNLNKFGPTIPPMSSNQSGGPQSTSNNTTPRGEKVNPKSLERSPTVQVEDEIQNYITLTPLTMSLTGSLRTASTSNTNRLSSPKPSAPPQTEIEELGDINEVAINDSNQIQIDNHNQCQMNPSAPPPPMCETVNHVRFADEIDHAPSKLCHAESAEIQNDCGDADGLDHAGRLRNNYNGRSGLRPGGLRNHHVTQSKDVVYKNANKNELRNGDTVTDHQQLQFNHSSDQLMNLHGPPSPTKSRSESIQRPVRRISYDPHQYQSQFFPFGIRRVGGGYRYCGEPPQRHSLPNMRNHDYYYYTGNDNLGDHYQGNDTDNLPDRYKSRTQGQTYNHVLTPTIVAPTFVKSANDSKAPLIVNRFNESLNYDSVKRCNRHRVNLNKDKPSSNTNRSNDIDNDITPFYQQAKSEYDRLYEEYRRERAELKRQKQVQQEDYRRAMRFGRQSVTTQFTGIRGRVDAAPINYTEIRQKMKLNDSNTASSTVTPRMSTYNNDSLKQYLDHVEQLSEMDKLNRKMASQGKEKVHLNGDYNSEKQLCQVEENDAVPTAAAEASITKTNDQMNQLETNDNSESSETELPSDSVTLMNITSSKTLTQTDIINDQSLFHTPNDKPTTTMRTNSKDSTAAASLDRLDGSPEDSNTSTISVSRFAPSKSKKLNDYYYINADFSSSKPEDIAISQKRLDQMRKKLNFSSDMDSDSNLSSTRLTTDVNMNQNGLNLNTQTQSHDLNMEYDIDIDNIDTASFSKDRLLQSIDQSLDESMEIAENIGSNYPNQDQEIEKMLEESDFNSNKISNLNLNLNFNEDNKGKTNIDNSAFTQIDNESYRKLNIDNIDNKRRFGRTVALPSRPQKSTYQTDYTKEAAYGKKHTRYNHYLNNSMTKSNFNNGSMTGHGQIKYPGRRLSPFGVSHTSIVTINPGNTNDNQIQSENQNQIQESHSQSGIQIAPITGAKKRTICGKVGSNIWRAQ